MAGETKTITWSGGPTGDYTCSGTNDYQTINSALSWASANPGNTIYLKGPHTYDITDEILIGSSTVFTGDSTAVLRLNNSCMWASMKPIIGQIGGAGTVTTGVEISGFEIDANEANLTHDGVGDPERIHGKGYYNCIYINGQSASYSSDIHIHNLKIHDSMGDGVRLGYCSNVRVHDCDMYNLQHCSVFCIDCEGVDVYENTIQAITTSGTRFDNCRNWKSRNNTITCWDGATSAPKGGAHGVQCGNQPSGHTNQTQNGEIYNNTISVGASGIHIEDYLKTAGTSAQNIHIYNNELTGCGWTNWAKYFAGIDIYNWGNGILIENNTIIGSYRAGILAYGAITSGVTVSVKNNNITGSVKAGTEGGYGIWNKVSSSMSLVCENNYLFNNATGNYLNVTPISEAGSSITDTLPGDSTTTDDVPVIVDPGTGIELPEVRIYQKEKDKTYYIPGRTGYINGKPFNWAQKKVDVGNSLGQDKCPGAIGWALTDFDLEGAELTLDCGATSLREMHEAIAAFTQPGRVTIELGGDFSDWQVTGTKGDYSTDLRLNTVIPSRYHPYSLLLVMDNPYFESVIERIRSRYIYNSMLFSSDDCYAGNLVKNSSFEDWTPSTWMAWESQPSPYNNEWRTVRYSKELVQFCAVAVTGTDTRVMVSDGETWHTPTGLTNATNCNNDWRGLCWCPEWLLWVTTSTSGTGNRCMTSSDGETWTAKTTPADNAWAYLLWIPPNDTLTTGRVLAFSYGSTDTDRVMYLDSPTGDWTQIDLSTLNPTLDTSNWYSAAYSPELHRVVAVAYSGSAGNQAMYSDDYGDTWSVSTTPTPNQQWTSIVWADALGLFVACSQSNVSQQIMTSETGLANSWTLHDTPIADSTVTPGTGDISSSNYTTPSGYVYSSIATAYAETEDSLEVTIVLPALTDGHLYRIEQVSGKLRTGRTGQTAHLKITATSASRGTVTLVEWYTSSTSYLTGVKEKAENFATNETVTIKYYLKSSCANCRAYATALGYKVTETGTTDGAVSYTYHQWRAITWSSGEKLLVCVAQTGDINGVMQSNDAINWTTGELPNDNAFVSLCYANDLNKFVAVAASGTGNRIVTSDNYGTVSDIAPDGWTFIDEGQARSDLTAYDGQYSIEITGNGNQGDRGTVKQVQAFESGTRYVLSAYGTVTGRTTGALIADIVNGTSIVKELVWDADCEWSQRQISFKFDVAPTDAYVRVRGNNLNTGAVVNCDKILIEKASDFELAATGSDIATYGTVDTIPDVIIKGVTNAPDTATSGTSTTDTTESTSVYSSIATAYSSSTSSLEWTVTLPALSDGAVYKLEQISGNLKTASVGKIAYLKVTVTNANLFGGVETSLAEWTNNTTSYVAKVRDMDFLTATNQTLVLKYYMKTSNASYRAYATELGYKVTTLTPGTSSPTTSGMFMWNEADHNKVMTCCYNLLPKYQMEINADGTGLLFYAEDFVDDNYVNVAYAASKVTYNEVNKTIAIDTGGYITFVMDCTYPVAGIPFLNTLVKSGAPQVYIADSSGTNGAPGTFIEIDKNESTDITNAEAYRLLDNPTSLQLQSCSKFYVKITPNDSGTLELGSLLISADLSTVDAERFKIYKGGQANTIGVQVTGKSSCVATLRYRDLDPAA